MPEQLDRKIDLAFKKLQGVEYSSTSKQAYEEKGTVPFSLTADDIWTGNIPLDPTPIKNNTEHSNVIEFISLVLTEDKSVAKSLCYKAINVNGNQLDSFIPPRFGQLYNVNVFVDNKKIYATDSCSWNFDYESGILTFLNSPPGDHTREVKIEAYRYIGPTLTNNAPSSILFDETLGNLLINSLNSI